MNDTILCAVCDAYAWSSVREDSCDECAFTGHATGYWGEGMSSSEVDRFVSAVVADVPTETQADAEANVRAYVARFGPADWGTMAEVADGYLYTWAADLAYQQARSSN